ncbi:MAG: MgtC/SapB family protein [Alphaproteobacteria bacterium]
MDELELFKRLGVALAAGMLIGLERGWHERAMPEGSRVAGIRTFAIIGLLGGLWALLGELVGEVALGFAFLAFAVVMIIARVRATAKIDDYGITTVVAALVTFALGAIALRGQLSIAAAGAVVTALLLGIKPALHELVERIEAAELNAVLKLLLMTIVLLPVLPDRGFGPWKTLNPYELWWMVVLIATMHFVGYVAVKLVGEQRGIPLAGLAGGLVASTAVAVSFSRLARKAPAASRLLAAGIVLASATMFVRVIVIVGVIEPKLLAILAWPFGGAALTAFAGAVLLWRHKKSSPPAKHDAIARNPFEFGMALKFGLLLAFVMIAARGLKDWFGAAGIYALSLLSGVADVDAVTLSLSKLAGVDLSLTVAAAGIALATVANTVVKAGITSAAGGMAMARTAGLAFAASLIGGVAATVVMLLLRTPAAG